MAGTKNRARWVSSKNRPCQVRSSARCVHALECIGGNHLNTQLSLAECKPVRILLRNRDNNLQGAGLKKSVNVRKIRGRGEEWAHPSASQCGFMFTADESCSGLPHFFWRARAQDAMFFDCSQEQEDLPRAGRILGRRMFLCVGSSSKVRQILSSQQLEVEVKISNNDTTTSRRLQVFNSLRIRGRAGTARLTT